MATASAMSPDSGFSQKTGMPASTPARISWVWALVAAAMTIPSTPLAISASGESATSAPNRSATAAVTAGTSIGDDQGVDAGEVGQGVGVERADPAESDQAETHGFLCE